MKDAIEKKEQAVKNDKLLKKRIADLESELDRKKRLALSAIAARSNIKVMFDDAV